MDSHLLGGGFYVAVIFEICHQLHENYGSASWVL